MFAADVVNFKVLLAGNRIISDCLRIHVWWVCL